MRAAGQHGFGEVDTPGSAFGVLRLFKEKLRYAVRKAPKLTPHIVKFSTPLPKWYQEGEGDGPCGINKDPTYVVDIPLRKTNYSAPSSSAPSSSSRGGGDQGAGQFDYRNLAQCLQNLMQMGRSQAQEGGAVNLTFPNRGRRQKALGNGPATAIEDDSQNSQVSPKETQNTQKTPALGDAQVTPPEKREIFTPPAEAPAEVKVYSPAEASARVQEAIDRRTAKRKAEKAEEEEEADATVLKKPAAKKAAAKKSGAAPKKPPKPTAGRPPVMAEGAATCFYLGGKINRNNGGFRAFKYAKSIASMPETKRDRKFSIEKLGEAEAWKRALDYIEEGTEVD